MIRTLLVLATAGAAAATDANLSIEDRFANWGLLHGKEYKSEEELQRRLHNFAVNHNRTLELAKENPEATFGETKFSDMTFAEFKAKYLTYKANFAKRAANIKVTPPKDVKGAPTKFDWKNVNGKSYLTPVKDQMNCGSCWAFSGVENIESAVQIKTGTQHKLSVQEVVSCETVHDSEGCDGGFTEDVMAYVMANGLSLETSYPYLSGLDENSRKCEPANIMPVAFVADWAQPVAPCFSGSCAKQDEDAVAAGLAEFGPLSTCVYVADAWMFYTGGILSAACSASAAKQDHCVQLTAYNKDEGSWTIRNSWGPGWGEAGFMRVKYGINACGILDDPLYAIAK